MADGIEGKEIDEMLSPTGDLIEVVLGAWRRDLALAVRSIETALKRKPARADELVFCLAALLVHSEAAERRRALPWLAQILKAFPKLVVAHAVAARAHEAVDDRVGARAAYRRAALFARKATSLHEPDASLTRVYRALSGGADASAPTVSELCDAMIRMQAADRSYLADHEASLAVATEVATRGGELEPAVHSRALQLRALSLFKLERHEQAVEAFEAIPEPRAELPPLRAGEIAYLHSIALLQVGRAEEALAVLESTLVTAPALAAEARRDQRFEPVWHEPRFLVATAGLPLRASGGEVEHDILEADRLLFERDVREALRVGHQAHAKATIVDDPALIARALRVHGLALAANHERERASATLARAVELAERHLSGEPTELAAIHEARASVQPASGGAQGARRSLERALELHLSVKDSEQAEAVTRTALAKLAFEEGDFLRAEEGLSRAVALVAPLRSHAARLSAAIACAQLVRVGVARGSSSEEVVARADDATSRTAAFVLAGGVARSAEIPDVAGMLRQALPPAFVAEKAAWLRRIRLMFELAEESDTRVRSERRYWAGLRDAAAELLLAGATPQELALDLARALEGRAPLVATHPSFAELAAELAARLELDVDRDFLADGLEESLEVEAKHDAILDLIDTMERLALFRISPEG